LCSACTIKDKGLTWNGKISRKRQTGKQNKTVVLPPEAERFAVWEWYITWRKVGGLRTPRKFVVASQALNAVKFFSQSFTEMEIR